MCDNRRTRFDVVSVGEALLDFVAPEADSLAGATTFLRAPGGAPANVAVAASRLGACAAFAGALGADPFGESLREILENQGVDTSAVHMVAERTTLAFVARNVGGIPDFLFYRGADTRLRPEDVPDELIGETAFLHLSSLALLAEPSGSATISAGERAREQDTLVSVDPNLRPSSWASSQAIRARVAPLLASADVLKVNDEEARLLTGEDNMQRALPFLGRDDSLVLVTLGPEGCLWRWQGKSGSVTSPRVEVVETTGAGDAFVGAVLAELCRQRYIGERFNALDAETVAEIARFACAAGALACTAPGAMASLPSRAEVEDLLSTGVPKAI